MRTITLPAVEAKQDGTRQLVTRMRVGDLEDFTRVDKFVSTKSFTDADQGYQRPEELSRVKKFANWLKREGENSGKVRMPTAILLSGRGSDIVLSREGTITLKSSNKLPLVDGQHRKRGFEYAIGEKGLTQFADYEVPVVIMLDMDLVAEMRQFSIVNGTQKSVRTDLVNMILTQLAEREGAGAVREGEHWKVVVSQVVKHLNNDGGGPWQDGIVMPDQGAYSKVEQQENEDLRHRRTARATSFMQALKPIEAYLAEHFTGEDSLGVRSDKLFEVVNAFWRAVRDLNPECFEKADEYVMLKTPGIFALHRLCFRVMKDMYVGMRKWTEDEFREVLGNCEALSNPAFWAVGNDESDRGEAAKYGSMKGFSELADLLYEDLRG